MTHRSRPGLQKEVGMDTLGWIVAGGLLMSAIALVGGVTAILRPATLDHLLMPMVSLAAGSLFGGAFFHMIPEGMASLDPLDGAFWLVAGFTTFLGVEQFLMWHHAHRPLSDGRKPVTYLILVGDAIHNFVGGLGIASAFLIDPYVGILTWIVGAAHEVPQELGDFGILINGGWPRRRALLWNFLSALTFPIGAVLAYGASQQMNVAPLMLFGAGNFVYIAASDLIPEIKSEKSQRGAVVHFSLFVFGIGLMFLVAYLLRSVRG